MTWLLCHLVLQVCEGPPADHVHEHLHAVSTEPALVTKAGVSSIINNETFFSFFWGGDADIPQLQQ